MKLKFVFLANYLSIVCFLKSSVEGLDDVWHGSVEMFWAYLFIQKLKNLSYHWPQVHLFIKFWISHDVLHQHFFEYFLVRVPNKLYAAELARSRGQI